jgi:TatD DNase family protein
LIDTHCHLQDKQFELDRAATVARALEGGVTGMLAVGCDLGDSARAIAVAERFGLRASVGIHPHEAKDAPVDAGAAVAALAQHERVVAIGETGLDYYYDHSPRETQARILRAQLGVARESNLPLVFHQRDAYDDFVAILRQEYEAASMRGVVHCFTGNTAQARTFVGEFGLLLGIGGVLTFANAHVLREAVRAVGLRALVLETDAPYLAPVPVRGRRNEPAFVVHTAAALARTLEADLGEVVAVTDRNALALFGPFDDAR